MMIPYPVILVPIYGLFKSLGWIGTFKPLWVPSFLAGAFNVLFAPAVFPGAAQGHDRGRPDRRMQRTANPAAHRVAVVPSGVARRGDFPVHGDVERFSRAVDFPDGAKGFHAGAGPLRVSRARTAGTAWHQLMAASTLVALPVIVLFFLAQRTFIEGIASTGGK